MSKISHYEAVSSSIMTALEHEQQQDPKARVAHRLTFSHPLTLWNMRPQVCPEGLLSEDVLVSVGVSTGARTIKKPQSVINRLVPEQYLTRHRVSVHNPVLRTEIFALCRNHNHLLNYLFNIRRSTDPGIDLIGSVWSRVQSLHPEIYFPAFAQAHTRALVPDDLQMLSALLNIAAERVDPSQFGLGLLKTRSF